MKKVITTLCLAVLAVSALVCLILSLQWASGRLDNPAMISLFAACGLLAVAIAMIVGGSGD